MSIKFYYLVSRSPVLLTLLACSLVLWPLTELAPLLVRWYYQGNAAWAVKAYMGYWAKKGLETFSPVEVAEVCGFTAEEVRAALLAQGCTQHPTFTGWLYKPAAMHVAALETRQALAGLASDRRAARRAA